MGWDALVTQCISMEAFTHKLRCALLTGVALVTRSSGMAQGPRDALVSIETSISANADGPRDAA